MRVRLREEHRVLLQDEGLGLNGLRPLDLLFQRPPINVNLAKNRLDIAFRIAKNLVEQFAALGLLEEITGGQRNRVFRYNPYWRLLEEPETAVQADIPLQTIESEEQ